MTRCKKVRLRAGLAIAAATLGLAVIPSAAGAYVHNWQCHPWPDNIRCNDTTGVIYNPWVLMVGGSNIAKPEVCIKAVTQAGNLRSTTNGSANADYCTFNQTIKIIHLTSPTPTSQAYVYWNGGGTLPDIGGSANT